MQGPEREKNEMRAAGEGSPRVVAPAACAEREGSVEAGRGGAAATAFAVDADDADEAARRKSNARRSALIALFGFVACVWFALDAYTKALFNVHEVGEVVAGPFFGLVQFRLVHNTGMAWGMFGDSTLFLGVFSLLVCVAVVVLFCLNARRAPWPLAVGLGLVLAGGLGNAVDRLTLGYVVDFIETAFMRFPVFNVADIGVTCGIVIAGAALFHMWREEENEGHPATGDGEKAGEA